MLTPNVMHYIGGMKIQISPDNCFRYAKLPDWYRAEFNAWARGFFTNGTSVVPDGQVFMLGQDTAVMNVRTFAAFKKALP